MGSNLLQRDFDPAICNFPLIILNLSHNTLGGSLPDCLGKLTNLTQLLLDRNSFKGPVPSSYKSLSKLVDFTLHRNVNLEPHWNEEKNCAPVQDDPCKLFATRTDITPIVIIVIVLLLILCGTASYLLQFCGWKVVLALLESMITAKFQPDAFTFNGALCAMGSPETWPMALHFMRCMQRQEIQVSLITYGALITCCEKAHQWQRALELLQGLKRQGKADVISYSAAISACEKARRASVALELLDEMRRVQVRTDDISCNAALSACEKSGYWQMGLSLLEQINALSPGSVSFNASISAMSSISAWSSAVALFHAMRRFQVQPDDVSYNAAITTCEGKHWWVGLHFFSALQQQDPVRFEAELEVQSHQSQRSSGSMQGKFHLEGNSGIAERYVFKAATSRCNQFFFHTFGSGIL
eukprot:symbB.v1.2.007111.t1/scaffold430.1/size206084/6